MNTTIDAALADAQKQLATMSEMVKDMAGTLAPIVLAHMTDNNAEVKRLLDLLVKEHVQVISRLNPPENIH